ncbi:MAG TPA: dethiobiotin synthase [Acidimicrobiales bacterium]|nr:dethiobiotin synthase [Acidimicrobiales bacterium]
MVADTGVRPDRLVVVVGTGTGVGKTWVAARVLEALRDAGHPVAARKPAQSFDPGDEPEGTDAAVLGRATGESAEEVCALGRWYPAAMAPPMAASVLGRPGFGLSDLVAEVRWPSVLAGGDRTGVGLVETAGGVCSPQADDGDGVALARLFSPDVVVLVADAGLGTLHAVRSSLAAMTGTKGLPEPVVVLNRFDPADDLHRRNADWLGRHEGVVPVVSPGGLDRLAREIVG